MEAEIWYKWVHGEPHYTVGHVKVVGEDRVYLTTPHVWWSRKSKDYVITKDRDRLEEIRRAWIAGKMAMARMEMLKYADMQSVAETNPLYELKSGTESARRSAG